MQECKTNAEPNTSQECKTDTELNQEQDTAQKCETDVDQNVGLNSNFDELRAEMEKNIYWVRFFCRPCCPSPGVAGANKMLDRLRDEALESSEYTQSQKDELVEIIEQRRAWYPHSGLCRK